MQQDIVLASASPRRAELLKQLGLKFTVQVAEIEEDLPAGMSPVEIVSALAKKKATAVAEQFAESSALVIGADTIVVKDGLIIGKPMSEEEAVSILECLSGAVHQVYSGICVIDTLKKKNYTDYAVTDVRMRMLPSEEIRAYVETGEGSDKAGAYGIQGKGAVLIEEIRGSYSNVVGLPLEKVYSLFSACGFNFWETIL